MNENGALGVVVDMAALGSIPNLRSLNLFCLVNANKATSATKMF